MNIFVIVIFYSFVVSIYADFGILHQVPNATFGVATQQFLIQINQTVNKPQFSAFIQVYNGTSNISIYQINVQNGSNVTYTNDTLIFYIPQSVYNTTNEFCITFDAGVLFSNITNSSAQNTSQLWHFKVINLDTTTSITTILPNTSIGTTHNLMTDSSVSHSDTSVFMTTQITSAYTSMNQTTQNPSTTTTTVVKTNTGEPSPTRSAKLGMGLGITFISIIIIGEIIYFKYCYTGGGRTGSYYT